MSQLEKTMLGLTFESRKMKMTDKLIGCLEAREMWHHGDTDEKARQLGSLEYFHHPYQNRDQYPFALIYFDEEVLVLMLMHEEGLNLVHDHEKGQ